MSKPREVAILCLFNVPGQTVEWHWKKIAGVPFILRNILNLQYGGIGRLLVYTKKLNEIDERCLRDINGDPRVRLELEWISESKQLATSAQGDGALLVFDGSTLHSQADVSGVLRDAQNLRQGTAFTFPLQDKVLNRFLEDIDDFSLSRFEKILNEDLDSDFVGQRRKLIFLPGAQEALIAREEDFATQHELLLQGCGFSGHGFFDRRVTRPMLQRLTRLFLGVPPHLMTALGCILGLGAAYSFYQGTYWSGVLGALVLLLSTWIDRTGGEVARLEFMETKARCQASRIVQNLICTAVFIAIGMREYAATGAEVYKLLSVLVVLGMFFLQWDKRNQTQSPPGKQRFPMERVGKGDVICFLLFMAFINQTGVFLMVASMVISLSAAFALYEKARPTLIPVENGAKK